VRVAVAGLLALLAFALARTPDASAAPPAYYPSGPQVNVSESQLTGWTQCWSGLYNGTVSLATILASCQGDYLLLAGGPVGSTTFNVVAAAPRADVIHDTGNSNTPHDANGTGWYYSSTRSWGFAKQGDAINRSSCDFLNAPNPTQRLCWHTSGGNMTGGYRSGSNINLNSSTAFRRAIYVASAVEGVLLPERQVPRPRRGPARRRHDLPGSDAGDLRPRARAHVRPAAAGLLPGRLRRWRPACACGPVSAVRPASLAPSRARVAPPAGARLAR
jgi:hypothetical protein